MNLWVLAAVFGIGAAGGFVNVFIGDSGLHLPRTSNGVLEPGFLAVVLAGGVGALGSWATLKAATLVGSGATPLTFSTVDIANALVIGFGGAKWLKSESEKDVLQHAAAIAASKQADPKAVADIAGGTPGEALAAAMKMQ